MKILKALFLTLAVVCVNSFCLFAQSEYQEEVKGYALELYNSFSAIQSKSGHLTF